MCFHVCELTIQRLVRVYRYRNTPLLHEETRGKRGLDGPSIVCRIFYSIRVAAFLPPRTFLRRRQYSFEPLQPSVESVYKVAWCVCVCVYLSRRGIVESRKRFNLKRTIRILVVRTFSFSDRSTEFSTRTIETTKREGASTVPSRSSIIEMTRDVKDGVVTERCSRRFPDALSQSYRSLAIIYIYIYLSLYGCTPFE